MYCNCGNQIEQERLELNLSMCKPCAFSNPAPRPKGRMVYSGKVGGEIEIYTAESWISNKKYFQANGKGRSCVKNFSKNIAV